MVRRILKVCGLLVAVAAPWTAADAQRPTALRTAADSVPKEYQPPAGMCRIWLNGVPPTQQPAPTECSLAVRNKPPNGVVVYGPQKGGKNNPGLGEQPIKPFDGKSTVKPPIRIPGRPGLSDAGREPWEAKRITDDQLFADRQENLSVSSSGAMATGGAGAVGFDAYVGQGGLLLGTGPIADPRYFSGTTPPPGRGSTSCLDRDGDGWCDDFRFGPPPCLDRDKDGRCDDLPAFASAAYPQVLPRMQAAVDVMQGRPSVEVAQWLGTNEFVARLPDQGRGTPWRAIFLDANTNQLLQVWTDRNKDGLVDRVEVFRDGQRVKLIQR